MALKAFKRWEIFSMWKNVPPPFHHLKPSTWESLLTPHTYICYISRLNKNLRSNQLSVISKTSGHCSQIRTLIHAFITLLMDNGNGFLSREKLEIGMDRHRVCADLNFWGLTYKKSSSTPTSSNPIIHSPWSWVCPSSSKDGSWLILSFL